MLLINCAPAHTLKAGRSSVGRWRLVGTVVAALAFAATALPTLGLEHAVASQGVSQTRSVSSDFNGDGFPDLAIGSPGAGGGLGSVTVLYGSASGLSTAGSQSWTLGSVDLGMREGAGDQFGYSIATGHFRASPFADLAIGVPGKNGVVVLAGSAAGLRSTDSQFLHTRGQLGGLALAAGDFNGDGFTDLAVGDPYAYANQSAAGRVDIYYGGGGGLGTPASKGKETLSAGTPGMPGPGPGSDANFGFALATGDFNGDGFADIAVGIPGDNNGVGDAIVLYGSPTGAIVRNAQLLTTYGDAAGYSLAAGDFNRDGFADLAVGEPQTTTSFGSGVVEVRYGSTTGLRRTGFGAAQLLAQQTAGMPGPQLIENDQFGLSLAAADFNGDGFEDLAIGVPGLSAALVVNGSSRDLTTHHAQYVPGIGPHVGALRDPIGVSVVGADFTRSGCAALVVGEPYTDTSQHRAGAVEVHPGSASGVTALALGTAQVLSADSPGMAGGPSSINGVFGWSLAVG